MCWWSPKAARVIGYRRRGAVVLCAWREGISFLMYSERCIGCCCDLWRCSNKAAAKASQRPLAVGSLEGFHDLIFLAIQLKDRKR